jgi:GTP-binding protein Era
MELPAMDSRTGFVGLIGRPNVGKSTLLNALLGQKLAIATPRPQTTRNRVVGVKNVPGAQVILVDTPGLHRPTGRGRTRLNRFMVGEALAALADVDMVVLIAQGAPEPGDRFVLEEVRKAEKPAVLAINKVDLVRDKQRLLPMIEAWGRAHAFSAMVPISALKGDGVERLLDEIVKVLPEGPPLYPEEMLTDRAERWIAAELVREQLFLLLKQEVPYAVAVTIDEWQERAGKGDVVVVSATIHVEKDAQKKIVVGQGGRMIREVGTRARLEIEKLLATRVHLELFVRVDAGWTESAAQLRELGYESE